MIEKKNHKEKKKKLFSVTIDIMINCLWPSSRRCSSYGLCPFIIIPVHAHVEQQVKNMYEYEPITEDSCAGGDGMRGSQGVEDRIFGAVDGQATGGRRVVCCENGAIIIIIIAMDNNILCRMLVETRDVEEILPKVDVKPGEYIARFGLDSNSAIILQYKYTILALYARLYVPTTILYWSAVFTCAKNYYVFLLGSGFSVLHFVCADKERFQTVSSGIQIIYK